MSFSFQKITPRHAAGIGLILFILLMAMEIRLITEKRALAPRTLVESTIRITEDSQLILNKTLDAKLAQTDFLYTGDEDLLYLYYSAIGMPDEKKNPNIEDTRTISDIFREIHVLAQSDAVQDNQNQEKFESLVRREFDYIGKSIEDMKRDRKVVRDISSDDKIMADIRAAASIVVQEERAELAKLLQANESADQNLDDSIVATTLTSNIILISAVLLIIFIFNKAGRAEKKLYAREAYFRAAVEGTLDAFFIFSAIYDENRNPQNLVLADINPAAERMLAATPAELLGRSISAVLPASADKMDARETCLDVLRSGVPQQVEYIAVSGPAAGRSFQQQIIPVPDGVTVTCRDITERKKIERMKNEFVSTVSHELRTPLTSIRGSLGLITGGVAGQISDQAKNLLTIAYNNCERLVRLINDILDIEKIESGGMVFQMRAVPLLPMIRQVIDANQAFATKYDVGINLETGRHMIDSDEIMVTADSDRLAQVLTNLLSNAVKFSHQGGKVTVRARQEKDRIRIEVEDRGLGIPKDFQSRIFEKFAQADSSDTRQKGGTGLGLSIVKSIVKEMKGEIGFESHEGRGTIFHFTLPLVTTAHAIVSPKESRSPASERILVCEDEPDIAQLLTLILERAGFAVDIAPNAAVALALLREQSYLAMTLDLALPDKDGIMLIKELRADPRFASLPIVVVSVKAEEGRQELEGDAFGILDWLKKPIDMSKLVDIVQGLHAASVKPRILHVEDDNDIVAILRLSLENISEFVHAPTLREAQNCLAHEDFSLVILDVNLPDGQGTDLLPLMVDRHGKPIPVVLFTAIEVPHEVGEKVAASLTKSRTSEEQLLATIKKIIADGSPAVNRKAA